MAFIPVKPYKPNDPIAAAALAFVQDNNAGSGDGKVSTSYGSKSDQLGAAATQAGYSFGYNTNNVSVLGILGSLLSGNVPGAVLGAAKGVTVDYDKEAAMQALVDALQAEDNSSNNSTGEGYTDAGGYDSSLGQF